jgi:hypothetical protein
MITRFSNIIRTVKEKRGMGQCSGLIGFFQVPGSHKVVVGRAQHTGKEIKLRPEYNYWCAQITKKQKITTYRKFSLFQTNGQNAKR